MGKIVTKAFLDNGSSTCFCSESLLSRLNCNDITKVNVNIETIHGNKQILCNLVSGLSVLDYKGRNCISLPPVLSTRRIPVDDYDCVRTKDLECCEVKSTLFFSLKCSVV